MAYLIGFLILLFVIGAMTSAKETRKGARQLKDSMQRTLQLPSLPTPADNRLVVLLERLHIEGYGLAAGAQATREAPEVVHDPALSELLQQLLADGALEQVLPRLGFSIRSTAACSDLGFSRQFPRMLITPGNHAIGYRVG